jgi:hypothetical protein
MNEKKINKDNLYKFEIYGNLTSNETKKNEFCAAYVEMNK